MAPGYSNLSARRPVPGDDGTRQLLQWGSTMVGAGLVAALLLVTELGGYTRLGATTNSGWFALIVALMCVPFGSMLLALGLAKWLRKRGTTPKSPSSGRM